MDLKQLNELVLFLFASDSFDFKDPTEVCIASVSDVNEVSLHKGFRWGGSDLESFQEKVDFLEGRV